uniref:Uncharacterized protein n=1 Tax=Arundo donax TaxID=35708 RepID=A0A0A8ZV18_ARUDO
MDSSRDLSLIKFGFLF